MSVDQDEHPLSSLMADLRMAAPNDEDASREKSLVGALFDASHDCLKILTPDGRLMAMNKACLLGMEIDDAEAVNGSEWTSLWPQEHRSLVETYLHRAAAGQAGGFTGFCPTLKGAPRWWDVEIAPIFGRDGRVVAILGASLDITQWVESHQNMRDSLASRERALSKLVAQLSAESLRLAEAQRALDHSQKLQALGEFIGVVVHDLNNVLAIVDSSMRVLRRTATDDFTREILDQSKSAIARGTQFIRQLLEFSRFEEVEPEIFEPASGLKEVADLVASLLGPRIDVELECPSGCWPIKASRAKIESVFLNLAANARDAMPEGGHLFLKVENVPAAQRPVGLHAGDYVRFEIKDTGRGMTDEVLAKVGKPFFTTKARGVGTGLGVASAFRFAENAQGRAKVISAPGRGCSVVFYIPRHLEPEAMEAGPPCENRAHGAATIVFARSQEAEEFSSYLRQLGYTVVDVFDDAEARAVLLQPLCVDLVIVEVGAVDISAIVHEAMLRAHPDAPLALLADGGYRPIDETAIVMRKPLSKTRFAEALLLALGRAPAKYLPTATLNGVARSIEKMRDSILRKRLSEWLELARRQGRAPALCDALALLDDPLERSFLIRLSGDKEFPAFLYEQAGASLTRLLGGADAADFFEPSHQEIVGSVYRAYRDALRGRPHYESDEQGVGEWLMMPLTADGATITHMLGFARPAL